MGSDPVLIVAEGALKSVSPLQCPIKPQEISLAAHEACAVWLDGGIEATGDDGELKATEPRAVRAPATRARARAYWNASFFT